MRAPDALSQGTAGALTGGHPDGILFLTGTLGSGKSVTAAEVGDLLGQRSVPHALVDLDWLCWVDAGPGFRAHDELGIRNLVTIWPNLRDAGARYLVLARALPRREPLDALRAAFPETPLTVIRLEASPGTLEARLRARDSGRTLREHLIEVVEMTEVLDRIAVEDAVIRTDGIPIEQVAQLALDATGWT